MPFVILLVGTCLLAIALMVAIPARSEVTVKDYLRSHQAAKADSDHAAVHYAYLIGMMETAVHMLKSVERRGGRGPFCPPEGAQFDDKRLHAILSSPAARKRAGEPIQAVLIDALAREWPCR